MVDYLIDVGTLFDEKAAAHSPKNAYFLGLAAKLAYAGGAEIRAITTHWGFDPQRFEFFDNEGSQGFYAENERLSLVAFRGTASFKDWTFNLRAKPVAGCVGQVHEGFQGALNQIGPAIVSRLKARPAGLPVWITGHSLGGAMARLCAADLHFKEGITPAGLYTFGQPRVGDLEFILRFEAELGSRTFRYVNDHDIVPHVPPHSFGYRHEHERFFFDAAGNFQMDQDQFEEELDRKEFVAVSRDALATVRLFEADFDGIADHSMEGYVANLRRQIQLP